MVVGAFPIAKLSVLLIKQISKPIANICKERAKNNPFFRNYVCMPPAQFYNWCEVKAKMWILNLGKPVNIPVLSQEMAIELGANLLGETVIFVIGSGLLIFEYNRQSSKEYAKELKRENELKHISSTITDLYFTVQQQQTQLREMERIIYSISGKKTEVPPPQIKPPPSFEELLGEKKPTEPPSEPENPTVKNTPAPSSPSVSKEPDVCSSPASPNQITTTPYPNKGIVLQSLNYIQMDVLSSLFPNNYDTKDNADEDQSSSKQKRNQAVLSEALYNIENNFRSLF